MENWPLGDIDNELQDLALKHGLIKLKDPPPDKPCGEECTCAEHYDNRKYADYYNGQVKYAAQGVAESAKYVAAANAAGKTAAVYAECAAKVSPAHAGMKRSQ